MEVDAVPSEAEEPRARPPISGVLTPFVMSRGEPKFLGSPGQAGFASGFLAGCTEQGSFSRFSGLAWLDDESSPKRTRMLALVGFLEQVLEQLDGRFRVDLDFKVVRVQEACLVQELLRRHSFVLRHPKLLLLDVDLARYLSKRGDDRLAASAREECEKAITGSCREWVSAAFSVMPPASQACADPDSDAVGDTFIDWNPEDCLAGIRLVQRAYMVVQDSDRAVDAPLANEFEALGAVVWARLLELGGEQLQVHLEQHRLQYEFGVAGIRATFNRLASGGALMLAAPRSVQRDSGSDDGRYHVVLRGIVPPANDRWMKPDLERLSRLAQPLPVAQLPEVAAIDAARSRLAAEFPWCLPAIDSIFMEARARRQFGARGFASAPVLLVGPAGCGKTRLARRVAEEFGLLFMCVPMAGSDARVLAGTSRGWASAQAAPFLEFMVAHETASFMLLADEIDKAKNESAHDAGVLSVLLGMLEVESAARWHDKFLQAACDISKMLIWATANSTHALSKPLLSRFHVIEVDRPTREQLRDSIPAVLSDIAVEWGVCSELLPNVPSSIVSTEADNMRAVRALVKAYLIDFAGRNAPSFVRQ